MFKMIDFDNQKDWQVFERILELVLIKFTKRNIDQAAWLGAIGHQFGNARMTFSGNNSGPKFLLVSFL